MIESSIESLWEVLGKKPFLLFGKECFVSSIWIFISLFIRTLLVIFKLNNLIPLGIIFALPYTIQSLGIYIPQLLEIVPLLTVRIAETILGRVSSKNLSIIIPAHFIGNVFGAVLFKTILPLQYFEIQSLSPIIYDPARWIEGLIIESITVFLYVSAILILPELLDVNKLSRKYISIPLLPIMLIPSPEYCSSFNPAAVYALWLIAPIFGSVLAGILCLYICPDDNTTWKQKINKL